MSRRPDPDRVVNEPARRRASRVSMAVALATVVLGSNPGGRGASLTIMPLGDSITYGFSRPDDVPGGYRAPLYRDLTAAGYDVQMVGSSTENPDPTLPAAANSHEGHVGYQIDGTGGVATFSLNTFLGQWLAPGNGVNPNIILLDAGVNEILGSYHQAGSPYELAALITRISELRPNAQILVSTLTPLAGASGEAQAEAFNQALGGTDGVIAQLQRLGEKVSLVNAGGSLTTADLGTDGIHPNQGGYDKMAQAWADAIELSNPVVAPEPSTFALFGAGFLGLVAAARVQSRSVRD